jgi:hypothetical protein
MRVSKAQYLEHVAGMSTQGRVEHDKARCNICIGRIKTKRAAMAMRERRAMIADMCGTSYAAAKRDMGL